MWHWESYCNTTSDFPSFYVAFTGRMGWKHPVKSLKGSPVPSASPTLPGPIRRSISCPRSIASLSSPGEVRSSSTRPSPTFSSAAPLVRPSSATLRSHSLSRSVSAHRVPHSNSLGTIHSNIVRSRNTTDALIIKRSNMFIASLYVFLTPYYENNIKYVNGSMHSRCFKFVCSCANTILGCLNVD